MKGLKQVHVKTFVKRKSLLSVLPSFLILLVQVLLVLVLLPCTTEAQQVQEVPAGNDQNKDNNNNSELYCTIGFGSSGSGSGSGSGNKIKILPSQINDGYCDCPFENGIDEFNTDACAGSAYWAGVNVPGADNDNDNDNGNGNANGNGNNDEPKVTCPEQPNVHLSLSKINDSICDCCDGYDEQNQSQNQNQSQSQSQTQCPNNCDEVLAEERERQKELRAKYRYGSIKRQANVDKYQQQLNEEKESLRVLQTEQVPHLERKIRQNKSNVVKMKQILWRDYNKFMQKSGILYNDEKVLNEITKIFIASDNDNGNGNDNESVEIQTQKLKQAIYSICQLYGEHIADNNNLNGATDQREDHSEHHYNSLKSCIPLRLAGLDVGLLWTTPTSSLSNVTLEHIDLTDANDIDVDIDVDYSDSDSDKEELTTKIATLLLHNYDINGVMNDNVHELRVGYSNSGGIGDSDSNTEDNKKSPGQREERGRKDQEPDFDDDPEENIYYDDDDHYDHEHYYDDDLINDYREKKGASKSSGTISSSNKESGGSVEDKKRGNSINNGDDSDEGDIPGDIEYIFYSSLGQLLRKPFYENAQSVLSEIDSLLGNYNDADDEDDVDDENNNDEDSLEENLDGAEQDINIDPMALTMVRSALSRKMLLIDNGNEMAQTAQSLIEVLERDHLDDKSLVLLYLKKLVSGTIYHSNLLAADIAEALVIADFDLNKGGALGAKSCFDWYDVLCNSGAIGNANFADEFAGGALAHRCQKRSEKRAKDSLCGGGNVQGQLVIPSHISDGYYNFYLPLTREKDDYYSMLFKDMKLVDQVFKNSVGISKMEEGISFAEDQLSSKRKKVQSLTESIEDEAKYGPDGVLYSLRDECFEIVANKYTYELCMFGNSYQREGGKKGTGTALGSWSGLSLDEENGSLIYKWENGQKCWNGPKRSSTVFVTCGVQNQVLSADEPNICEYEFKMESFVACDDTFRDLHNIEV